MMSELLVVITGILGAIIASFTIINFSHYTKDQVDRKVMEVKDLLLHEIDTLQETINKNQLESQQNTADIKDEINDKLGENKQALEDGMRQFINILTDIKQTDKDTSVQFLTMLNTVKEELKNDYTSRYNDLLLLINTKADEKDFNRLEQKFDKISETIVELKTIVELQLKDKQKHE